MARLPMGKRAAFLILGLAAALIVLLVIVLAFPRSQELTTFAMGSYVRQTVWGGKDAPAAANEAINRLENRISWRRDGDVAKINEAACREPVAISPETRRTLETALGLCEASDGALDITMGEATKLWNFDGEPRCPEAGELEKVCRWMDYHNLLLGEEACRAFLSEEPFGGEVPDDCAALVCKSLMEYQEWDPDGDYGTVSLDLGAIGKGAACDIAVESYRQSGVKSAVVAVGGSVGLYGKKPWEEFWTVAVRDPAGSGSMGTLKLPGGFVSTSGSYEKTFEYGGYTWHHLLDPRSPGNGLPPCRPAQSGLVSVTVWCPPGMEADYPGALSDGLATACFVLGLEDSIPLLEQYGAQALFIDEEGLVTVTEGLKDCFTLTAESYTLTGEVSHGE